MMTALCFLKHGPRRVPVEPVDGRLTAKCPECPRTFTVLDEQIVHEPDEPAAFVFRLWHGEPEERIIVVIAGTEADARAMVGDEHEHDEEQLELVTTARGQPGIIVDSAVYP